MSRFITIANTVINHMVRLSQKDAPIKYPKSHANEFVGAKTTVSTQLLKSLQQWLAGKDNGALSVGQVTVMHTIMEVLKDNEVVYQPRPVWVHAHEFQSFKGIVKKELKDFFDDTPEGLCSFVMTPEHLIIVYKYDDEILGHDCTVQTFKVWNSSNVEVDSNYLHNDKQLIKYGVSEKDFQYMDMNDFSVMFKESSMDINDILYIGVRVEPKVVERALLGTPYENYPAKKEAHMTIAFKPSMKILSELLPLLGHEVELSIHGVGDLTEDGVVKNVGLKIKVAAPEYLKDFMPENNIPHITVWTNDEAGARAVNTYKCAWKIPLQKTIRGRIAAFNAQNDWAFTAFLGDNKK